MEFLADVTKLLTYLGEKVGIGHICLYCNGRGRLAYSSLRAVQQHMVCNIDNSNILSMVFGLGWMDWIEIMDLGVLCVCVCMCVCVVFPHISTV